MMYLLKYKSKRFLRSIVMKFVICLLLNEYIVHLLVKFACYPISLSSQFLHLHKRAIDIEDVHTDSKATLQPSYFAILRKKDEKNPYSPYWSVLFVTNY